MTLAEPVLPPQEAFTSPVVRVMPVAGCVTVYVPVPVHPCESVTVTVYEPAARPDAVAVACCGTVLQI